jgi:hypothetical protein
MNHALLKIVFTKQPDNISDVKDTINFCVKIKRKFNVLARASFTQEQLDYIVVSALGESDEKIERLFDKVLEYCDSSEFGRVYESSAYVESIDDLDELNEVEPMEYDP